MRLLRFGMLALVGFLRPVGAATVDLATTCVADFGTNPPTATTVTGAATCNFGGATNSVTATAMGQAGGSFSLAGNALRLSLSASIFANVPYAEAPAGQPYLTNASATASITDWLDTGGPLRAGIVEITQELLNGYNSGGENSDGVNVSLDSVRGECTDSMCLEPVSAIQAVELGEPFELSGLANATGSACTGMCAGAADSSVSASFTMEFFEADGVTPVNVFETIAPEVPVVTAEPGSWALLVVGLAGILGWGLLRRLVCRPV